MIKRFVSCFIIIAVFLSIQAEDLTAVTEFSRQGSGIDGSYTPETDIRKIDIPKIEVKKIDVKKINVEPVEKPSLTGTDRNGRIPVQYRAESTIEFKEIWGYLMRGEEKLFRGDEPVTDICYFSCGVNSKGRINTNVKPPRLPDLNGKKRRVHIVISQLSGYKLMHKALSPGYKIRNGLVSDIIEVSKKFDGVQIDFEAVSSKDAASFHKFLRLIKAGLEPGKIFSVALPSRVRTVPNDAFDYSVISGIADRVYIMAYDQHWSTSKPGPVASLSWCKAIIEFAREIVPAEKLIMGIPLYGREWEERLVKGKKVRVVKYKKVRTGKKKKKYKRKRIVRTVKIPPRIEKKSRSIRSKNIPELAYGCRAEKEYSRDKGLSIKVEGKGFSTVLYCDDVQATREKFVLYSEYVDSVGFWRLGMQSPDMWREISIVD
ncbi:MAG TPA: glycosyl hydrolase family 18 protein [Spirochaetota bacterium]|nr:glycosyl hydrolase family 18 protein [Spirochaetota bacterium]